MSDCLFCQIVAGELSSEAVAESENAYAFRDIHPAAPVHVLVVPRRHIGSASDVGPEEGALLAEVIGLANQVARSENLAPRGYRLVFNVGDDALNSVPHLHLHVLGGRRLGAMG